MTNEIRRLRELAGLNRDDKFILNELFDKPYPYEWTKQKNDVWKAEFKNVDGHAIYVDFQRFHRSTVKVRFFRNNEIDITGQKDQFKIFATVLTIMKDFIKNNNNVFEVYFTAAEISRESLYRRMLNRFANEDGFEFEESKVDGLVEFRLIRKEFVLNELFDKPYSYTWVRQDHKQWRAKIKNVDGNVIDVWFDINDENYGKIGWVYFNKNDTDIITGQKDQFRIYATVLTIIKDFIENNNDVIPVCFTAEGISRVYLYRRMLSRFAVENDFYFKTFESGDITEFYLRRKK